MRQTSTSPFNTAQVFVGALVPILSLLVGASNVFLWFCFSHTQSAAPSLPPDFEESRWEMLKQGVEAVFHNHPVSTSLQQLYLVPVNVMSGNEFVTGQQWCIVSIHA